MKPLDSGAVATGLTHREAVAWTVLGALLWSIAGLVTRRLESAAGFEVTFWRSVFAAATVLAWLLAGQGRRALAPLRHGGAPVLVSGVMWAVMFTCFMVALTLTSVANVLITQSLAPVFTALLASAVLGKRIAARTWVAIVVAALGIATMYAFDIVGLEGRHLVGVLVALGIPAAAAVNWVNTQRAGRGLDLTSSVLLGALLSMLLTLPLAWPLQASAHDIGLLALLGVVQLGIPCILVVRAARRLAAHEVALLALLEVLFGIVLAWAFAGERPGTATLFGGALVLAALVWNELASRDQPPSESVLA